MTITLEQRQVKAAAKLAHIKVQKKKKETAQKLIIGKAVLSYAKKHPAFAGDLLTILYLELKEYSLKRIRSAIVELETVSSSKKE